MGDCQPPGLRTDPASIPSDRTLTAETLDRFDCPLHMLCLGICIDVSIIDPAPTVGSYLVSGLNKPLSDFRYPLEGQPYRECGDRQSAPAEQIKESPDAHPAAVLVMRFHNEIAPTRPRRRNHVGVQALGHGVSISNIRFRALLDVEDERQRKTCSTGPARIGWIWAIASQIT